MPVSPVTVSADPARLTRRTVLAGTLGLVALGCAPIGGQDDAGPRPESSPETGSDTGTDGRQPAPDVATVAEALRVIRATRAAVTATVGRIPDLAAPLAPLLAMHSAHEAALADAGPVDTPPSSDAPYVVPRRRAPALDRLGRAEDALHSTMDRLAGAALSGDLARLLASMGAAVAQRRSEWPR